MCAYVYNYIHTYALFVLDSEEYFRGPDGISLCGALEAGGP